MSTIIGKVFSKLQEAGIGYCILRNYEMLPSNFPSGDIDILVDRGKFGIIRNIVEKTCLNEGWSVHGISIHAHVSMDLFIHAWIEGKLVKVNFEFRTFLLVNFPSRFRLLEYTYLDAKLILDHTKLHNGLRVISPPNEAAHLICEILFEKKSKYQDRVVNLIQDHSIWPKIEDTLIHIFGANSAHAIFEWVTVKNMDPEEIDESQWMSDLKMNHPVSFGYLLQHDLNAIFQRFIAYLFPSGKFCLFLGPDGSGKTLLADEVAKACHRSYTSVKRIHLGNRPILLRSFKGGANKLGPGNQVIGETRDKYHTVQTPDLKLSVYNTLRYCYHVADYVLHYWLVLRPMFAQNCLILSERYIYDYVVASDRYLAGVPIFIKKVLSILVPRPDYVFLIDVEPDLLVLRKRELPIEIIKLEQQGYKSQIGKVIVIDNNKSIPDSIRQILLILFK